MRDYFSVYHFVSEYIIMCIGYWLLYSPFMLPTTTVYNLLGWFNNKMIY